MPNYIQKLVRNGNSTGVNIPRPLLEAMKLAGGMPVVMSLQENGALQIRKFEVPGATVVGAGVTLEDFPAVTR